jgi:hypothetical protein
LFAGASIRGRVEQSGVVTRVRMRVEWVISSVVVRR